MPWIRRKLKDNVVYAETDNTGNLVIGSDGRVTILYKLSPGAKTYRAGARNLAPAGDDTLEVFDAAENQAAAKKAATSKSPIPDDAVIVYTDGACTGNPGPAGLGVVIIDGEAREELSEYLGLGTNNIAELTAILRALEQAYERKERTVVVHSDSSYSIGLLTKGWKAKANTELVANLRRIAQGFADLRFVKVKGHAGIPENERCDELARMAVVRGR